MFSQEKRQSTTHTLISGIPFLVAREAATMSVILHSFKVLISNVQLVKYATATLKVLYTYSGWSSVNYVLNDVRDPVRTLKISGPLGLAICAALYILANVAYFAYGFRGPSVVFTALTIIYFYRAATKEEIQSSGVTISALFFQKVFGEQARRALSIFVALRSIL